MIEIDRLKIYADNHNYPLLFATISGAHLYGFPSADSDFDLRGAHCLSIDDVLGLKSTDDTVQLEQMEDGLELDLVTHDIKKFFGLMLKRNGYVLEQLYSPLVVVTAPEHDELKSIGKNCITRFHANHYLGFADTQWKLLTKESPPRIKPLLYVYRVLLTGIFLMKTGRIEANLMQLNEHFELDFLGDLIQQKLLGKEKESLDSNNLDFHRNQYNSLINQLEVAASQSDLPDRPSAFGALNDLLIRLRKNLGTS